MKDLLELCLLIPLMSKDDRTKFASLLSLEKGENPMTSLSRVAVQGLEVSGFRRALLKAGKTGRCNLG